MTKKFLKLIGGYESILMLRDKCPAKCPSIKVELLVMYVWGKYFPVQVTLTDLAGKDVLDVTGKVMKCCIDRNGPDKRKSFSTAVWCIHKAHKQTGTYDPSCKVCCCMPEEGGSMDEVFTKVTLLVFEVEIQQTIISSLIVWTRYILIVKSTEGS